MNPNTPIRMKTKELYITSAIQIIMQEGYEAITVRKLSELTGLTYPTLYHHFSDLSELMLSAKNQMISDMVPVISKEAAHGQKGIAGLKETFRSYTLYYIKNPNVFRFFYYYTFPTTTDSTSKGFKTADFEALWFATFSELIADGVIQPVDVPTIAKTIIYSIHGMITLTFSNSGELTADSILEELDSIIDYLLHK